MKPFPLAVLSGLVASVFCCGGEPAPVAPRSAASASAKAAAPPADAGAATPARFAYPDTPQHDVAETLHGVTLHDRFRWLEDGHDEKVQAWASAENAFARARLAKLPDGAAIKKRLTELFYVDSESAPSKAHDRYFWSHRSAKQEKSVVF
ncbi:MAG TPA: hypothetical protein VLM85_26720, partial [Polyangiaceae bacterium]|nr:hypothetical protein [Polyangiaceae bacterium]